MVFSVVFSIQKKISKAVLKARNPVFMQVWAASGFLSELIFRRSGLLPVHKLPIEYLFQLRYYGQMAGWLSDFYTAMSNVEVLSGG